MAAQSTLMLSDNKLFRCHRVYTFYVCMGFHPLPPLGIRDECNIAHCNIHIVLETWSRLIPTHTHSHRTSNITHSRPALMFQTGEGRRHWVSEYINKSIPTHGLIANACRKTEGQKPTTPPITTKCLLLRCFIVDSKSKCIAFHPPSLRPSHPSDIVEEVLQMHIIAAADSQLKSISGQHTITTAAIMHIIISGHPITPSSHTFCVCECVCSMCKVQFDAFVVVTLPAENNAKVLFYYVELLCFRQVIKQCNVNMLKSLPPPSLTTPIAKPPSPLAIQISNEHSYLTNVQY